MASTIAVNRPLKDRYWLYRDVVLHHRKNAATMDDLYWQYRPTPPLARKIQIRKR